jgi:hypothetical protein
MANGGDREAEAARLEDRIAEVCGLLNAVTGQLVDLAQVLDTDSWQGWGIRSAEQWVSWKCGVSPARARSLVAMAHRLRELPETKAALEGGELSEDQAAVVCRRAPAHVDAEAAMLARSATVVQLRRVLGSYTFTQPEDEAGRAPAEEPRRVGFDTPTRVRGTCPPYSRPMRVRSGSGRCPSPVKRSSKPVSTIPGGTRPPLRSAGRMRS